MKGKRVRIGCAAASILMGISGTYAYYRSSVETINKIAVGDVNIGIWEYEEDGDGEKKYEGPENGIVLPSQVISKIPRITNYAEPCYVRVKPVFDEEETQDYRLGEEDLGGIEDVWLKAGEYYYYPKVLGKQESVDFFALRKWSIFSVQSPFHLRGPVRRRDRCCPLKSRRRPYRQRM